MHVSIIILFIANPELTLACVTSVRTATPGVEILLVDNGAPEDVHAWIAGNLANADGVRLIRNPDAAPGKPCSFAQGNNFAASIATRDVLVFLNNDTEVLPGWLPPLLEALERQEASAVQPRLTYPQGTIQCAGLAFSPYSALPYHIFKDFPKEHPAVTSPEELQAATGACMGLRRQDFLAVGGFDERFVNGSEDVDLCLRLRRHTGRAARYVPASEVIHYESASPGRQNAILANRKLLVERLRSGVYDPVEADDGPRCLRCGLLPVDYVTDECNGAPPDLAFAAPQSYVPHPLARHTPSVLIVKPSGLGNMLMFLPALRALKELLPPNSSLTVLCYAAEANAVRQEVDETLILEKHSHDSAPDRTMLASLLGTRRFHVALYPPFTNFADVPWELEPCAPVHIHHTRINYTLKHEVEHNLDLIRQLGWQGSPTPMEVTLPSTPPDTAAQPHIAVHVGASDSAHMRKKRWPVQSWALLLEVLSGSYDIVFTGTKADLEDVKAVRSLLPGSVNERCREALGSPFTSSKCANAFSHATLFIGNDAGTMHLATAAGVKTLALFGPTSPSKNSPWGKPEQCRMVLPLTDCAPCYVDKSDVLLACGRQLCLESVTPQRVLLATESFMLCKGSEEIVINSRSDTTACPICGGRKFLSGPYGRKARNGGMPLCAGCNSLERHRALFLAYKLLPEKMTSSLKALQFSEDPSAVSTKFRSLEISAYGGENHLDICAIDRENASYDWVICNHVLEHAPDPTKAFTELLRILTDDGVLELCVPDPARLMRTEDWGFADDARHGHYREFGADLFNVLPCGEIYCLTVNTLDPVSGDRDIMFFFCKTRRQFLNLYHTYRYLQ